ncbi:ATP-dependent Lon protease [Vibrio sp. SM6]|uniref:ATP-dependent Lon protease n=1 Tax=Vibrio agarilyticus TaxID=2726741 RepID=A0A7X8YHB7_9VIBR|nr:ATP-dependent Lon protease [Vibrio agarilyticus]NLS13943.1 ATP-dependent Lon protease [Vibrio agarilyticus]
MLVSPTTVNAPLIAPSVNVHTEQTARENRIKAPIAPTVAMTPSQSERRVQSDEKRRRNGAWDPADHPDYQTDEVASQTSDSPEDPLARLFELLSLNSYSQHQGTGYTIRFKLPKRIIDAALREGMMEKRRIVIRYHYGHSVAPNTPSDVIAVL